MAKLIGKVLAIGGIIAILAYLFHPGVGQLSLTINGEPVAAPLVRFAAIPTVLAVLLLTGLLAIVLFFGFGLLMFFGSLFFAFIVIAVIAPYLWPILVIIGLIIAFSGFNHGNRHS